MKQYSLGFVGAGNMAQAIIAGAIEKGTLTADTVYVYDVDAARREDIAARFGVKAAGSLDILCKNSEMLLLAIKPNVMPAVLSELKSLSTDLPVLSIAAGWSAQMIKDRLCRDHKVLRLMPNTPLMVGEGMSVFETPTNFNDNEQAFASSIFSALGKVEYAPQKLMDAVTAVSGSGPAYVYIFIEALADAGVLCGLPRNTALTLAAQTVYGASKTVMDTGTHPGVLKDAVCSPGGTTIEAVKSLEQGGFRGAVIDAVEKCALKSKALAE